MSTVTQASTPKPPRHRWFPYVKPYLPWFIIGPLCMIVEVIGEVVMPKLLAYIIDYGVVMAGVTICTLPTVIIFFFLQKSFTEAIAGSVK